MTNADTLTARLDDKSGAKTLIDVCTELGLSHQEWVHLLENVFPEGQAADWALEAFLKQHARGKANRFILNLLPPRAGLAEADSANGMVSNSTPQPA